VAREQNPERRPFYELAWHLGASQSDLASGSRQRGLATQGHQFQPSQNGQLSQVRFGAEVEAILKRLPANGPSFPICARCAPGSRHRIQTTLRRVGITGVSCILIVMPGRNVRAVRVSGRFAQEAFGHNSQASASRLTAKRAKVILPSLEAYEHRLLADPSCQCRARFFCGGPADRAPAPQSDTLF